MNPSESSDNIRPAAWAGSFYPQDPPQLRDALVQLFTSTARLEGVDTPPFGVIVPHAGYRFSAAVAARAFVYCAGAEYDSIILLGPNHKGSAFFGTSVWAEGGFRTPLGTVPVDKDLAQSLIEEYPDLVFEKKAHTAEHSLEVQLPMLQVLFKNPSIVPITMSDYSAKTCAELAQALARSIHKNGKRVLYVASTDFSHYVPLQDAQTADNRALALINAMDPNRFFQAYAHKQISMCGFGPTLTVMICALMNGISAAHTLITCYNTSAAASGNTNSVVGYGSACIFPPSLKPQRIFPDIQGKDREDEPSDDEKQTLLKLARDAIRLHFEDKEPETDGLDSAILNQSCGIFVTLTKDNALRGCVGAIVSSEPLKKQIISSARSAAFGDRRFEPVTLEELDSITMAISLLTQPQPVKSPEAIQIGTDGIILVKGFKSALYLPEVASEQGWNLEETLSRLSQKAGLPPDSWKENTAFYTFQTIKFSE